MKSIGQDSSLKFNKSIKKRGSFRIKLVSAASQSHFDNESPVNLRVAKENENEKKQAHKNINLNKILSNKREEEGSSED